jgi:hypothetical protein
VSEPTPEDLARDLALCQEATPGPWRAERDALGHWRILWPHSRNGSVARKVFSEEDAAFIAAAREGWPAALRRLMALEAAVRKHRDCRGDDRCWRDDDDLYRVLPEGYTPPARDTAVELENCERYIACRLDPRVVYVSPQRRIEELEAEVAALKTQLAAAYDRVAAQPELLSRRAEGSAPEPRPGLSCWLCHKPIEGPVVYQGGSLAHPAHPGCLIVPCS